MQEKILNEILISVKQTNEKVDVLAITLKEELREEFKEMLFRIVQGQPVAKHIQSHDRFISFKLQQKALQRVNA